MLLPLGLRPVRFDQRGAGRSLCKDGRFGPIDYVSDVEAVRIHLGADRVHVFGHSWGGLLGQLYLARHPDRVRSLFLSSPVPGLGPDWRQNGNEVVAFNRRRAGPAGLVMGLASAGMGVRPLADASARVLIARVWRNYFPDPRVAPAPDPAWLAGLHADTMRESSKAMGAADPRLLDDAGDAEVPVLVEFGGDDIYETAAEKLHRRFPDARHETLTAAGHLPWLQDPDRFRTLLTEFFGDRVGIPSGKP